MAVCGGRGGGVGEGGGVGVLIARLGDVFLATGMIVRGESELKWDISMDRPDGIEMLLYGELLILELSCG